MSDGPEHAADSSGEELPRYVQAVESYRDHPVVERWFHQIAPCRLVIPGQGEASFLMIEFRDQAAGAMVWSDGEGHWGTGGWRPLPGDGVLPVDLEYLQNAPVVASFRDVLEVLAARRADKAVGAAPRRPWWKLWS